ncbi:13735_t:CDS:2 [Funneliformis geosporum]|uniref:13735_t:CDS:1 n=1 Tax=Funneliformis geosporum TaxID=1117311 RepID=A0A9W4SLY7_9GLOM|nr:13735_t:CDS:2 [Funneliformis geosporum]
MESSQNSQITTTIYNEKKITFDVPGWGHTLVSVNESMNAQNLYWFVGLDSIDIIKVIYRVDDLVFEACKDESVKFIYDKCDDKVVKVVPLLENVSENDIVINHFWNLSIFVKELFFGALQDLKFKIEELDIKSICYGVWQDFKFLLEVLDLRGMCTSMWIAIKHIIKISEIFVGNVKKYAYT